MPKIKIQLFLSLFFLVAYFSLLGFILYVETSDRLNMQVSENSMMGELQLLLGVLTAGAAQILNFWFGNNHKNEEKSVEKEPNNEHEDALG